MYYVHDWALMHMSKTSGGAALSEMQSVVWW